MSAENIAWRRARGNKTGGVWKALGVSQYNFQNYSPNYDFMSCHPTPHIASRHNYHRQLRQTSETWRKFVSHHKWNVFASRQNVLPYESTYIDVEPFLASCVAFNANPQHQCLAVLIISISPDLPTIYQQSAAILSLTASYQSVKRRWQSLQQKQDLG